MTNTIEMLPAFLGNFRGWEWLVIILAALLLFGGSKTIVKAMRNFGKGLNSFKQGLEEAKREINKPLEQTPADNKAPNADAPLEPTAKAKDIDR